MILKMGPLTSLVGLCLEDHKMKVYLAGIRVRIRIRVSLFFKVKLEKGAYFWFFSSSIRLSNKTHVVFSISFNNVLLKYTILKEKITEIVVEPKKPTVE
jgi:hypothetical protein